MREAHFLDRGAFGFHLLKHVFDSGLAFCIEAFAKVFLRNADDLALNAGAELCGKVFGRASARGVVVRVNAADCTEERCAVTNGCTERTNLVKRACVGEEAVTGNAAVGRLQTDNARAGSRLADRSTRVGTESAGNRARGDGDCGTTRGTTRNAGFVERILDRAVVRGFVAGTHGEFVHVRLADDDGACGFELFECRCSVGGNKVVENLGGGRGACAGQAHVVLHGDRDAIEGAQRLAFGAALVAFLSAFEGAIVQHRNIGVQILCRFNFFEGGLSELFGRGAAVSKLSLKFLNSLHYLSPDHFMM